MMIKQNNIARAWIDNNIKLLKFVQALNLNIRLRMGINGFVDGKIFYSYPGGFRIKNLLQNVAKQSAATKQEIESNNKNIRPFMVQMLIVAEPRNLDRFNLEYWSQIYNEDYTEEYFKESGKGKQHKQQNG